MPRHFLGSKDYNKKTQQYHLRHSVLKTHIEEVKAWLSFFELTEQLMSNPLSSPTQLVEIFLFCVRLVELDELGEFN